jgi:hypothetical protein
MAITITILGETQVVLPDLPLSRTADLMVENDGVFRRYVKGGLPAVGDLQPILDAQAEVIWAEAQTYGKPVTQTSAPIVQWATNQSKRLPYLGRIGYQLFKDMNDGLITNDDLLNNAIDKLNNDSAAFGWFLTYKDRLGVAGGDLTPADIAVMSAANKRSLMVAIYNFVNQGMAVGLGGEIWGKEE